MTREIEPLSTIGESNDKRPSDRPKRSIFEKIILEIAAILFWLYLLIKVFVFDIDIFLANKFYPPAGIILKYKLFILVAAIATVWLFTKKNRIVLYCLHVVFYPIIILIWRIPKFLWKLNSWNAILAFVNSIVSLFKSIKFNFIVLGFSLVLCAIIITASNKQLLLVSIFLLFSLLALIYIHRFIILFKPSALYEAYSKIVDKMIKVAKDSYKVKEDAKNLPIAQLSETQLQVWAANLQFIIIANRATYFLSSKLRDYQKSKYNILFYVINFLILVFITVAIFSVLNFGLYKYGVDNYSSITSPNWM